MSGLQDCKILYISAALGGASDSALASTSAFSAAEITLLNEWVSGGGALLVATDHPPMAQAAQKLLDSFGVSGSLATTKDPKNTIQQLNDPAVIVFSTISDRSSPILRGRESAEALKKVVIFDGQSLFSESGAAVFKLQNTAMDEYQDHSSKPAGGRAEMILLKQGKGRIVVTADATLFTSKIEDSTNEPLGINRPGTDNVQLALNTFHWLSGVFEN